MSIDSTAALKASADQRRKPEAAPILAVASPALRALDANGTVPAVFGSARKEKTADTHAPGNSGQWCDKDHMAPGAFGSARKEKPADTLAPGNSGQRGDKGSASGVPRFDDRHHSENLPPYMYPHRFNNDHGPHHWPPAPDWGKPVPKYMVQHQAPISPLIPLGRGRGFGGRAAFEAHLYRPRFDAREYDRFGPEFR